MATIRTAIELYDAFSAPLMSVVQAVNMGVSAMGQMQSTMNESASSSFIDGITDQMNRAVQAIEEARTALSEPEPVEVPIYWQSETMDVFTNSGVERFEQEVQSANNMLNTLNQTQARINQQAADMGFLPPGGFTDLANMQTRLQSIQQQIQTIENNPLNMGSDVANAELEQLRGQLNQAVQEQEMLNAAVENMDVQAANQAYLRLSQTVANTERYTRDNVDEQGRFNREIQKGVAYAGQLKDMIAGAFSAFVGAAGIKKALDFVEDCTQTFNTQLNAETQLISVLANMLDADYVAQFELETTADTVGAINEINDIQSSVDEVVVPVTAESRALTAAFDQITAKASEIQSRGIYGDETMIAAAAEFSTYFSDTDAIEMMMDTLSDYAMGMSGGGEVGSQQMVDYATNLGKIMSGAYDAMTKKGFELSDTQKAIIEGTATQEQIVAAIGEEYLNMSHDMQAAAAISSVIEESWAGLYETMSGTPEGKIIQMTNAWGDMREVIGRQLYPYVLLFVDAITENWSTIEGVVQGITIGLEFLLGVLSWLLEAAISVAGAIIDNWSWISPIIYGVAGALAVYYGWLMLTKGAALATVAAQAILTGAKMLAVPVYAALTGATMAETAAQWGLNSAMYACPIVWIIIIIIALIAVLYAVVAAVNHFAGTSVSATGIICGAFAAAGAFIWDLILGVLELVLGVLEYLINPFINLANFIGNVFTSPISSIIYLFQGMADTVLGILQSIASALDFVFGSNMADTVQGWRNGLKDAADAMVAEYAPNENYQEVMNTLDFSVSDLGLERIAYSDAWDAGYSFGEGIDESISSFDPSSLFGTIDIPSANDYANTYTGIGSGVDDIAENTGAIRDSMSITEEELKYMRDIAEQEAINRFTTAEIRIEQTNHNNISSKVDLDGVVDGLTDAVNDAVEIMAEGAHI